MVTAFFSRRQGMAGFKCKDHFATLLPFHEVLKAPGTVLIAHVVEHKQQTFGRVWEPSLVLQGPLPLWCQLSVPRSDAYFSPVMSAVPAGLLPLVTHSAASGANFLPDWGKFQCRPVSSTRSESVLCTGRVLKRPWWVIAISDPWLSSPLTSVPQNWSPTEERPPWERVVGINSTELKKPGRQMCT